MQWVWSDPDLDKAMRERRIGEAIFGVMLWAAQGTSTADLAYLVRNLSVRQLGRLLRHPTAMRHDVHPQVLVDAVRNGDGVNSVDIRLSLWRFNGWSGSDRRELVQWCRLFSSDVPPVLWRMCDLGLLVVDAARTVRDAAHAAQWRDRVPDVRSAGRLLALRFTVSDVDRCVAVGWRASDIEMVCAALRTSGVGGGRGLVRATVRFASSGVSANRASLAARTGTTARQAASFSDEQWQGLFTLDSLAAGFGSQTFPVRL